MTFLLHKGRYTARLAQSACDLQDCQHLRHRCFFGGEGLDQDSFDANCDHLMVIDSVGRVVATARLFHMQSGAEIHASYAAQFNDISRFYDLKAAFIEVGRFCIAPDVLDADVLRAAWAALTQIVDQNDVGYLFGCTSFAGTDPNRYGWAFKRLQDKHLGHLSLRPKPLAAGAIPLADVPPEGTDPMPPLLRTYLAMGGWVSDYAVIDHKMNTLHVFTCLAVASVPPSRAATLRALAQGTRLS